MASISASSRMEEALSLLALEERKDLLRLLTCGSVDDGKSTLIGRLLYDTQGAYEDQLASIQKSGVNRSSGPIDFSLLTDGLRAEREQGITIDVAYRYFATPRRKFIIADTPGHEQYTRNMATGASTAQLAIILIDARQGVLQQSRRHAYIVSLLGIPRVVVAINKMDLVGFSEEVYERIRAEFQPLLDRLGVKEAQFIPVSALEGDNVAWPSENMAWYTGPTLLTHLESVPIGAAVHEEDWRFPVQLVLRPHLDFRGYAGTVASGTVRVGDPVMVLPSGRTSRIKSINTFDGDLAEASARQAVTLTLTDEVDVSRGDMLVHPRKLTQVSAHLKAALVWMHPQALEPGRAYLLKHTTRQVQATVKAVLYRTDVNTLETQAAETLGLNEIGDVRIDTAQPLYFDPYKQTHETGAFILIDPLSNATVAAGMILSDAAHTVQRTADLTVKLGPVTPAERHVRYGHGPFTAAFPQQAELAEAVERKLFQRGCLVKAFDAALAESTTEALHASGMIVLTTGGAADFTLPAESKLGADDVIVLLEQAGWLPPSQEFYSGDGI